MLQHAIELYELSPVPTLSNGVCDKVGSRFGISIRDAGHGGHEVEGEIVGGWKVEPAGPCARAGIRRWYENKQPGDSLRSEIAINSRVSMTS